MLEHIISEWIRCVDKYYEINSDGNYQYRFNITNQLEIDMLEFVEANKALVQEQANTSNNKIDNQLENDMLETSVQEQANTSIIQSHSQAYYTSRKLTEILLQDKSECWECEVKD
ncbi:unnamed protein product [Rhizophagus irregularis]|uniref:Uncharacterized protein n=1 Tax=Rhizophagus irregularis TaxID=588596 RepID=A0A915ZHK5_9GLOM|nr:unnamed protein product [Rhizophagus irregularis]